LIIHIDCLTFKKLCILPTQHVYCSLRFSQAVPKISLKSFQLFIIVGVVQTLFSER